jgi:hypothetical protein
LIYQTKAQSERFTEFGYSVNVVQISVISIDLDNEVYEIEERGQELIISRLQCYYDIPCADGPLILIKVNGSVSLTSPLVRQHQLHVFKFRASLLSYSHRVIVVPKRSGLFNLIDGRIIFNNLMTRIDGCALRNFTLIEADNSFVEIQGTGVHLIQDHPFVVSS